MTEKSSTFLPVGKLEMFGTKEVNIFSVTVRVSTEIYSNKVPFFPTVIM